MKVSPVQKLTVSALLIAISIVIPLFSPFKIALEPASFTLASHVAIFIAMFISPGVAAAVAVGTTLGFFLSPFPIVVTLRAATHLVFALCGALYIKANPSLWSSPVKLRIFSFAVAVLHGACEVGVVTAFYLGGSMGDVYYQQGFFRSVMLLVGVGSVIHSMVDFEIAALVSRVLSKQRSFAALAPALHASK